MPILWVKDNLARYNDGHGYCFGCHYRDNGDDSDTHNSQPRQQQFEMNKDFVDGDIQFLSARGITEDTCRKWDYRVGDLGGQKVQVANYKDSSGKKIAQKVRFRNKDFTVRGDLKDVTLYGEHLWSGKGKRAVVTEGRLMHSLFLRHRVISGLYIRCLQVPLVPLVLFVSQLSC